MRTGRIEMAEEGREYREGDLIAGGYETTCPECSEELTLIAVPRDGRVVVCPACDERFTVGLAEHAYD